MTLSTRLRELLGKATAGPWEQSVLQRHYVIDDDSRVIFATAESPAVSEKEKAG